MDTPQTPVALRLTSETWSDPSLWPEIANTLRELSPQLLSLAFPKAWSLKWHSQNWLSKEIFDAQLLKGPVLTEASLDVEISKLIQGSRLIGECSSKTLTKVYARVFDIAWNQLKNYLSQELPELMEQLEVLDETPESKQGQAKLLQRIEQKGLKKLVLLSVSNQLFAVDPEWVNNPLPLTFLDYEEAQQVLALKPELLNPVAIEIASQRELSIELRHLEDSIRCQIGKVRPQEHKIKALVVEKKVPLLSLQTSSMWEQVGFLQKLFATIETFGLSVNLIGTSENNVTLSFDKLPSSFNEKSRESFLTDLKALGSPRWHESCASISFVGRSVRSLLPKLGTTFSLFEQEKVYLMTQSSHDISWTFVLEENNLARFIPQLYQAVFASSQSQWSKENALPQELSQWWWSKEEYPQKLLELAQKETPSYLYHLPTIRERAHSLTELEAIDRVFYAMKANPHPQILKQLLDSGLGIECVSQPEIEFLFEHFGTEIAPRLLFTPNFAPIKEYRWALDHHLLLTVDNLELLERWPEVFSGHSIALRLDPGKGRGHHQHVKTAGDKSKFGIPSYQIEEVVKLCQKHKIQVIGLHAHSGSYIKDQDAWLDTALILSKLGENFPDLKFLDLGGGLPVPTYLGDPSVDLEALSKQLLSFKELYPHLQIWIEPGRFLVAESGVLLTQIQQTKSKGGYHYLGVNTGMHQLIRPALYGAYHPILSLTHWQKPSQQSYEVVGPICESGDILGRSIHLPLHEPGDHLLIANAGAYCQAMSSNYNLRGRAQEIVLE